MPIYVFNLAEMGNHDLIRTWTAMQVNTPCIAQRILSEYEEPLQLMLEFVERFPDLKETPAQFQERCVQVALACFWKEQTDRETTLPLQPAEMEETSAAS